MSVVGIDLGTTNTVTAAARNGRVQVLPDPRGQRLLPSVVSFHPNGETLVGQVAKERRAIDAKNTIYSVKRLLGRPWQSNELGKARHRLPFELKEGPSQSVMVRCRGRDYSLPEISGIVLRRARLNAEEALKTPIERAVITVPAHFNELQRSATKVAARVAGLEVLRILNEPTAAALAYGLGKGAKERIAVYDFGGGTFDCTLLDLSGNVFEVLATAGDSFLGGDDVDAAIADRMAEAFMIQHRYDVREDPQAFERLQIAAERVKIDLSTQPSAHVRLRELAYGTGGAHLELSFGMTREELDVMVDPLIDKTLSVCQDALALAGMDASSFDKVILVGGSTRIQKVKGRVEAFFGREILDRINPDEIVGIGAAIQAAALGEARRSQPVPASGAEERERAPVHRRGHRRRPNRDGPASSGRRRDPDAAEGASAPSEERGGTDSRELEQPRPGLDSRLSRIYPRRRSPSDRHAPARKSARSAAPRGGPRFACKDAHAPSDRDGADSPARRGSDATAGSCRRADPTARIERTNGANAVPSSPRAAGSARSRPSAGPSPLLGDGHASAAHVATAAAKAAARVVVRSDVPSPFCREARITGIRRADGSSVVVQRSGRCPARGLADGSDAALRRATGRRHDIAAGALEAPAFRPAPPLGATQPVYDSRPPLPTAIPVLLDVTPRALIVETVGGFCDTLVPRNAKVPCERTRTFATSSDQQTVVHVRVGQGESARFSENVYLGELELSGLLPAPRGDVKIGVTFSVDSDGTLQVTAADVAHGRTAHAQLKLIGGMSQDEVRQATQRVSTLQ